MSVVTIALLSGEDGLHIELAHVKPLLHRSVVDVLPRYVEDHPSLARLQLVPKYPIYQPLYRRRSRGKLKMNNVAGFLLSLLFKTGSIGVSSLVDPSS